MERVPLSPDAVLTAVVLVATLGLLALDRLPPAGVMLAALVALVLADVVTVQDGFAGFASTAPLTVAALYVVAAGARRTGLLAGVTARLLAGDGGRGTLARLCAPVAALSAFFNNTPLVAMLLPEVVGWARRRRVAASRFLMPLSFAAIVGGTVTLIGTSTNLVVSGVLEQQGLDGFGLFELTPVGLPVAVVGVLMLVGLTPALLPERSGPAEQVPTGLRSFALHLAVAEGGPLVGRGVAEAGLRGLSGVFLADVVRGDRHLVPVGPDDVLQAGDLLVFVGDVADVLDLRTTPGLVVPDDQAALLARTRAPRYFEAVVGRGSRLVGATLKEVGAREDYQAAAVAIHRAGARLGGKLGDVVLRSGDTLVLLASSDLRSRRAAMEDFVVVAPLDEAVPVIGRDARWVVLALAVFVAGAATGLLATLEAALVAAGVLVGSRTVTFTEAKQAIDLDVVLLIATALGVGTAVDRSGLAVALADATTGALGGLGTLGVVLGILVTTTLLTEVVTNNAAAAVVVPIALAAAPTVGLDPRVMAVGVAVTASTSLLTPIGYQTNAMVYGPGGYRFGDFARLGGVLNVVVVLTAALLVVALG